MTKELRVVIDDAWRLKGRRPPARLSSYFSLNEWTNLSYEIYDAILPAIRFKQILVGILAGLFAIPLLSFVILLVLVLTGFIEIEDFQYEEEGEIEYQEEAFEMLLFVTTCGCLGLAFLCLLLGSAIRNCYYQSLVEDGLNNVIEEFFQNKDDNKDGVSIDMTVTQADRSGCQGCCRLALMSWCDLDFDLTIVIRENYDDYSRM